MVAAKCMCIYLYIPAKESLVNFALIVTQSVDYLIY